MPHDAVPRRGIAWTQLDGFVFQFDRCINVAGVELGQSVSVEIHPVLAPRSEVALLGGGRGCAETGPNTRFGRGGSKRM